MNKDIKGISIKIGADATPLNKALSDVDRKADGTQKELKKVNNSLKFNPKNVVLTAQKQQLLTNQIVNTKDKLFKLKSAEAQVQDQFKKGKITEEQYRAYQREIVETESKLKHYENQLKSVNKTSSKFASKMQDVSAKLNAVGGKMTAVGKNLTTKLSVPIAGLGIAAGKMSMDFSKSMGNINTLLDDQSHLKGYKKTVKEMSDDTGINIDVMSKGMYQAISSIGDGGKATEKMFKTMAKSAEAGGAEVSDSVALISANMKGYGQVNDKTAKKISDLAFATAKLGVTTFPEMAKSMQPLFPLSSSLNIRMEDLYGSMATLTGVTGNTSEVSTQLKAVFSNLMKPTKAMSELIHKYGYENAQSMIKSEGLTGVLQILQKETGGQSDKMAQLFGSTEALTAMTALSGKNFKDYKEKLKKVENSAGSTSEALKKVKAPDGAKFEKSINKMKNSMLTIGDVLSPIITKISQFGSRLAEKFSNLSPKTQQMIVKIGLVVAAIGPLLIVIGKIATGLSVVLPIIGAVVGAVGWIPLAIGAVIAIGVALYKNWDKIKEKATELKEHLSAKWTEIKLKTQKLWNDTKQAITQPFINAKEKVVAKAQELKTSISNKWENIKTATRDKFNSIKQSMIQPFIDAKNNIHEKIDSIKSKFNNLSLKEIKIPHIKLPHFHLTGEFSILKKKVPHLSVDWHAKGGIFTSPTLLPSVNGGLHGVGEAGPEAILPISKLAGLMADTLNRMQAKSNNDIYMKMLAQQEQRANKNLENNQKAIIKMLERYMPEYLKALDISVVLDDGTLVGKLTPKVDNKLGASYKRKVRGNV